MLTNVLKHRRRIGSVPFNGGNRQVLPLDLVGPCTGLSLRLRYNIVAGATAPVGPLFQQLARLIKRAEIIVQGRDTVVSVSGQYLAARVQYEQKGAPAYGMESSPQTPIANATAVVDITLPLRFDLPNGRRSDDCALDLRGLTSCQLAITWGGAADLFTTPGATVTITGQQLDVEAEYLLNVDAKTQYVTRSVDELQLPLTGSNSNLAFEIDARTGLAVRSLALFTVQNDIGVTNVLDSGSIKLEAGAFTFINSASPVLKSDVRRRLELASSSEIAGLYLVDPLYMGQLATAIATGKLDANLRFVLDATYTSGTTMLVCQREVVRPLKIA